MASNLLRSLGLVGAIAIIPAATASFASAEVDGMRQFDEFMTVFQQVRAQYVEKVDDKTLLRGAIDGMLSSLDPHSSYLDEKGYRSLMTTTEGEYGGLGLNVTSEDGAVKVITPIEDSPGFKAGDPVSMRQPVGRAGPREARVMVELRRNGRPFPIAPLIALS